MRTSVLVPYHARLRMVLIPRTPEERRRTVLMRALSSGILMWIASAFLLRDGFALLRRGEHASGSVVSIDAGRHGRSPRHAVVRLYGGSSAATCRVRSDDLAPGMTLPMVYLPDNPAICRPDDLRAVVGAPGVGFAVGAILTIGAIAWYERERRR